MTSTAAAFLAAGALRRASVTVCGHLVHVREMSVLERGQFLTLARDNPPMMPVHLVRLCVTDEAGVPLFGLADEPAIAAMRPEFTDGVARHVMELSGMIEQDGGDAEKKS